MITLRAGGAVLELAPEVGGAVQSWEVDGRPVFHRVSDPKLGAQRGAALGAYPLIPFSNRVAWGRFEFEGERHQLARNFGDHPHTIHGNAWMHPWQVERQDEASARLSFAHEPPPDDASEWPFAYRATIRYALEADRLEVTVSVENLDARRQPVGFGFHPYFPRDERSELGFEAATVWHLNGDSLPDARLEVDGDWRFDPMRHLDGPPIDNCFNGWPRSAKLRLPGGRTLAIKATEPFGHLVVFTPDGKDYFAVEPASNMTDAVNHPDEPDQGLRVLAPGERLEGRVTLSLS